MLSTLSAGPKNTIISWKSQTYRATESNRVEWEGLQSLRCTSKSKRRRAVFSTRVSYLSPTAFPNSPSCRVLLIIFQFHHPGKQYRSIYTLAICLYGVSGCLPKSPGSGWKREAGRKDIEREKRERSTPSASRRALIHQRHLASLLRPLFRRGMFPSFFHPSPFGSNEDLRRPFRTGTKSWLKIIQVKTCCIVCTILENRDWGFCREKPSLLQCRWRGVEKNRYKTTLRNLDTSAKHRSSNASRIYRGCG